jgi:arylsulfatase A-like enzyme
MYVDRELPPIPVGDWATEHDIPNPGLRRQAWRGRLTPQQNQRARAAYMGLCTYIDYQLGRLLESMARMGVLHDTMILFTSDHGDMMGDHHLHRKTYAYEGSARIPFLIRYPSGWDLQTGVFSHIVGLQDVMPTLLEAADIPIPNSVTGSSLLRAVRGEPWRSFLHGEHSPCYSLEQAMQYLTDGQEKYIYFPVTGQEQFFDLAHDRQELANLVEQPTCAERVAIWRERLIQLLAERGDGFSDGQQLLVREDGWSAVVQ